MKDQHDQGRGIEDRAAGSSAATGSARRSSCRRWRLGLIALTGIAALGSGAVRAQSGYGKPIRIVVTYPAGGPIDGLTRPFAQRLSDAVKTPVVVENRGGANGAIGYEYVAKSAPDGYTLTIGAAGPFAISPKAMVRPLPYDPVRDFAPVTTMATLPELLTTNVSLPVRNLKDLIALAKRRPGELVYASSGTGGTPHLAMELLKQAAKIDMVHVPYKGAGPATMEVIGGQTQLIFADMPVLLPQVQGGKLRALAIGSKQRSASLPDVQTLVEQGLQIVVENWYAVFAPAATPKDMIARLNADMVRVLNAPDTQALMVKFGAAAAPSTPDALAQLLRSELERWGEVVRVAGIKLE
jgi:tripartite-type tricarboxylate transporter receptor subunit TctC